jgi:very-short-patch-repair endonuclease
LRQLADDPDALPRVAGAALELCHFDRTSGQDLGRAAGAREDCVAACYDCLLSYGNQRDHLILDRHAIRDLLLMLRNAEVQVSPGSLPRAEQVKRLLGLCDSELEKRFVSFLDERRLELPTHAQERLDGLKAKPDFAYAHRGAVIFVDGPPHNFPDVEERDKQATTRLEDAGYHVIRVAHDADWAKIVGDNPSVFGDGK